MLTDKYSHSWMGFLEIPARRQASPFVGVNGFFMIHIVSPFPHSMVHSVSATSLGMKAFIILLFPRMGSWIITFRF